jgi:hypothetical protein
MVHKDKKFLINEGRAITNGKFAYGGFPRIINEEGNGATDQFRDDNLGDVATRRGDANPHAGKSFEQLQKEYRDAVAADLAARTNLPTPKTAAEEAEQRAKMAATYKAVQEIEKPYKAHPQYVPPKLDAPDTHKIDTDDIVAASFGRRVPSGLESPEQRGLRMGPPSLPPTDYDLGISGSEERRSRRR